MLEQLFRTNEAAQSTTFGVLMATLASFFLSFLLVLTYRLTSTEVVERREFIQGMALISIVATMIMQAIGDSLARGLGMLGALSIIRFRTSLSSPRNMAFMFASLAAGIACGVFGFTIAFIGTTAFCLAAFVLHLEFRGERTTVMGELRLTLKADEVGEADLRKLLGKHVVRLHLAERRYKLVTPPAPVPAPRQDAAPDVTLQTPTANVQPILAPETPSPEPEAQELLTFNFRMRGASGELELLRAVTTYPGVIDHRLRFTQSREIL